MRKYLLAACLVSGVAVIGIGVRAFRRRPSVPPIRLVTDARLLAADSSGQLKFDKQSLSAKAGNVTITMANPSPVQHAIAIMGNGAQKAGSTVSMGGTSTVTASLKPGTYTFYCPVDGHKAAGMQGTLTVK